jgi:phage-related protein
MKAVIWVGACKEDIRSFPDAARQTAGFQLSKVQNGDEPDDWKPMSSIGPGVREIRIRERSGAFRVIYVARFGDVVYVLHAFRKKTQKTSMHDIDLARERFRSVMR